MLGFGVNASIQVGAYLYACLERHLQTSANASTRLKQGDALLKGPGEEGAGN
jgi:hypothetical protein